MSILGIRIPVKRWSSFRKLRLRNQSPFTFDPALCVPVCHVLQDQSFAFLAPTAMLGSWQ